MYMCVCVFFLFVSTYRLAGICLEKKKNPGLDAGHGPSVRLVFFPCFACTNCSSISIGRLRKSSRFCGCTVVLDKHDYDDDDDDDDILLVLVLVVY